MTTAKKLGIWMDHASAHLMEFTRDSIQTKIVSANFTHPEQGKSWHKSELQKHVKEQHQQAAYYQELEEVIKDYNGVVLFGPTDAKVELFNRLIKNHHFDKIKIEVKQVDKMTENQEHAFEREYFSKH